jgi:hypothetical protein
MVEAAQFVKDVIQCCEEGGWQFMHCNGDLGLERAIETMQQEDFVARFRTQWQT